MAAAAACGAGAVAGGDTGGEWRALPPAPIPASVDAMAGWTGAEAVFWAGSNLRRDFAHTEGAAYDPATDEWRKLPVPGWGHPGLVGLMHDGVFSMTAKGAVLRLDPADGTTTDLPRPEGLLPAALAMADDELWVLGPRGRFAGPAQGVAIARYDERDDAWVAGPAFEGADEMGPLFVGDLFIDQPVVSTGTEIVVWSSRGRGLAYEPRSETWRLLPEIGEVNVVRSTPAVIAGTLVVVAETADGGRGVARWDDGAWTWRDVDLESSSFDALTVAAAGDWLVVLGPETAPAAIHVETGRVDTSPDSPIAGLQAPNTVWTGDALVVWGGVRPDGDINAPTGALWTPPA